MVFALVLDPCLRGACRFLLWLWPLIDLGSGSAFLLVPPSFATSSKVLA